MAGRNPKPGGDKARSGTARIRFDALNPVEGTPRPPAHLDKDAVEAWVLACRSLIPARLVSHIDLLALEAFAQAWSDYRRAMRKCLRPGKGNGDYSTTPNGHTQLSAARILANRALSQVMSIGAKFGMTPVERIKTTESAQGDLPLDDPQPEPDAGADRSDDLPKVTHLFKPRPRLGG